MEHRKLKLEIEELAVESFETAAAHGRAGTVRGHSGDISCNETCGAGCPIWIDKTTGCPRPTQTGGCGCTAYTNCDCTAYTDCDCSANFSDCYCGETEPGQLVCDP